MLDKMINWFEQRRNRVTYSMANRNGPGSYDCSSAVYYACIEAGLLPAGTSVGNTDNLFHDLEKNGFTQVMADATGSVNAQRGDIFIWGVRGASGGAFGHTGVFVDSDNIIHCNYGYNSITVNSHDLIASYNGWPELTVYRYTGASYEPPSLPGSPVDQVIEIGSYIKFDKAYKIDDAQLVGDTWQAMCLELCPVDFTWEDNGIPIELLVEVDTDGYATADQHLDVGSMVVLPGKLKVLDIAPYKNRWLAQVTLADMMLWIDVETATEVDVNDAGTPQPATRPSVSVETVSTPIVTDTAVEPPSQTEPATKSETNTPVSDGSSVNPHPTQPTNEPPIHKPTKEDNTMAQSQPKQPLPINSRDFDKLLKAGQFDQVDGWKPTIPDNVRLIVYLCAGIGLPTIALVYQLLAVFGVVPSNIAMQVIAVCGEFFGAIAGLFGLAHFKRSK